MRLNKFLIFGIGWGLFFLATSVPLRNAQAAPFYFEVQTGAAEFRGSSDLFGSSGSSATSDFGIGLNYGVFWAPFEPKEGFGLQLGLQHHILTASEGAHNFGFQAPYPAVRLQFLLSYISLGFAPLVWTRSKTTSGYEDFALSSGTMSYLAETGLLYSPTPIFSLGLALNTHWVTTTAGFSSQPIASLNFLMRFYFGKRGSGSNSSDDSPEYKGWRYIGK
jgi:hypothetical protein